MTVFVKRTMICAVSAALLFACASCAGRDTGTGSSAAKIQGGAAVSSGAASSVPETSSAEPEGPEASSAPPEGQTEEEEELDLTLVAGHYIPENTGSENEDLPELMLWENGVGILKAGDVMYGVAWTPDHLRVEQEDIDYSGRWDRFDQEADIPVLVFTYGGREFCFWYDLDILPEYYWGPSKFGPDEITGTYYGGDGVKAEFREDGTGTLEADGRELPLYWGAYDGGFLVADSYLSSIEAARGTIRFSTGPDTAWTLETEEAIAERELEEKKKAFEAKIQASAPSYLPLGNAGELDGRIVVYTIFASWPDYSWDFVREADRKIRDRCLEDLASGLEWIRRQAAGYGREVEFLYDWNEDPDLAAEYTSEYPMALSPGAAMEAKAAEGEIISSRELFVKQNIAYELADAKELKEKYGADEVVYVFLVNTDYENTVVPHAIPYHPETHRGNTRLADVIELVTIHCHYTDTREPGKNIIRENSTDGEVYAHEILHLFGAPDLYETRRGITQEYVDHLKKIDSRDIMFNSYRGDWENGRVTFSELDAYYTGLTDRCEDVEKYGLPKSQHGMQEKTKDQQNQ